MKFMQIRHLVVALALAVVAPLGAAAFQSGMTVEQAETEVRAQLAGKATLAQIAQRALAAGLNAGLVTTAMINATEGPVDGVIAAVLGAGGNLQAVVNAAIVAGVARDEITQGAAAAGVTLQAVLAAIANSPFRVAGGPGGALGVGSGGGTCTANSVSPC